MDKRQQKTQKKMQHVKQVARDLFARYGMDRVSMDEIAAQAQVSKVTIYKYFGSKEQLYVEVINLFVDDVLAATEAVINSDMDYLDKLKFILLTKTDSSQWVSLTRLFQAWDQQDMEKNFQSKVKALMVKFFEQGRDQGYIDPDIPTEVLYLYTVIFRAGLKATASDFEAALADSDTFKALCDVYFFGFINQRPPRHKVEEG